MKKGERIPEIVREFVRNLSQDDPDLSYSQIKERAEARFPRVRIDKSSVGNIVRRPKKESGSDTKRDPATQLDLEEHRKRLMTALEFLDGLEPLTLHDRDLATWWSRPDTADWPIPKGRAWRQTDGSLAVTLNAESRTEWPYLRQHFAEYHLWDEIENCKQNLARDLSSRLRLLDAIAERISLPSEEGGLALSIGAELGFVEVTRPEVTIYYVFTIYDQVLSQCLELRHGHKTLEEFVPGPVANTTYLGGIPVVRSADGAQREEVIQFLLRGQAAWILLPETLAAAEAYRNAKAETDSLIQDIDRLRLTPGFLRGSKCELCEPFVNAADSGTGTP